MKYVILLLIILFNNTPACTQTTPKDKRLYSIREQVLKMVSDSVIPSMAIAVIKDEKLIWQEAIGYADMAAGKKATINAIYPVGSVSKSITATGIMQLVNARKLELHQDIHPILYPVVLKDIHGKTPKIPLWQLLSMNAGINHGFGSYRDERLLPLDRDAQKKFFEVTTIIAFPPGLTYEYSNRAYYLAELIIERISKMSFQEYMDQYVFHPLNMKSTMAYPYRHKTNANVVKTYSDRGLTEIRKNITYPTGGSGLWSSLADMTNYARFHLGDLKNDAVISQDNLEVMHRFRQGAADLFGIGWFNFNDFLISNGNVAGGNASVIIDKKNKLAVVCLLNKTSGESLAHQTAINIRNTFVNTPPENLNVYRRIYRTPYNNVRFELQGTWKGRIRSPETHVELPLTLLFDNEAGVFIRFGDKTYSVTNSSYNLLQEFKGHFTGVLPGIYPGETAIGIKVKRIENTFVGYLYYDAVTDDSFYRLPLYVMLKK